MIDHEFKTWPTYFDALDSGIKTAEVRKNDRVVTPQAGEIAMFREWVPEGSTVRVVHAIGTSSDLLPVVNAGHYTGRFTRKLICHVADLTVFGLDGYVLLSLKPLTGG